MIDSAAPTTGSGSGGSPGCVYATGRTSDEVGGTRVNELSFATEREASTGSSRGGSSWIPADTQKQTTIVMRKTVICDCHHDPRRERQVK